MNFNPLTAMDLCVFQIFCFSYIVICFLCWQLMKKSVIGPELEKRDAVPPYRESKQAAKLKRKVNTCPCTLVY